MHRVRIQWYDVSNGESNADKNEYLYNAMEEVICCIAGLVIRL